MLVSRRSRSRVGTRYNSRGIDANGNVSNFVETEQILVVVHESGDHDLFAHVQVRGSVPCFWEQYYSKLKVNSDLDLSVRACKKHIDYLKHQYKNLHILNLMSNTISAENELITKFE